MHHPPSPDQPGQEPVELRAGGHSSPWRIVLVEDDPAQLAHLKNTLGGVAEFILVGLHASAEAAMAAVKWCEVDILLSDLELPGISGVALIERAVKANPDLRALAYTINEQREVVFSALKAGAVGYVLKGDSAHELIEAIHAISRGESPISPAIARYLLETFHRENAAADQAALSHREVGLLKHVVAGHTYKEMGKRLGLSSHTIHTHIKNIYKKLSASSRGEALQRARMLGHLPLDP